MLERIHSLIFSINMSNQGLIWQDFLIGSDSLIWQDFLIGSDSLIWQDSGIFILGSAFLGGAILNIMPCVLPILGLKLASMRQSSQISAHRQIGFLILGICGSFLLLGMLAFILRFIGVQFGWGFHFQQPIFVAFMMGLLLCLAWLQISGRANLLFAPAQNHASAILARFSPESPLFSLAFGALISLLASPCSAPFLGLAVAFALTQSLFMILLIFMIIALGLASPWIFLWLVLWRLPNKIEFWQKHFQSKAISAFIPIIAAWLLYGSSWWLFMVLSQQIGLGFAFSLFAIAHCALWILSRPKILPIGVWAMFLLAGFIPFYLYSDQKYLTHYIAPYISPAPVLEWHPFNETLLAQRVSKGQAVFVHITADWCLTCQYNEKHILSDREVQNHLAQKQIYLMRGDLTNPDPIITAFLYRQNRIGIPFDALYTQDKDFIFSEILDKQSMLTHLKAFSRDMPISSNKSSFPDRVMGEAEKHARHRTAKALDKQTR